MRNAPQFRKFHLLTNLHKPVTVFSILFSSIAYTLSPGIASAAGPIPAATPGTYGALMARHSGKCINIRRASRASGARAKQWKCNGNAPTEFAVRYIGTNAYNLVARHTGMCLEVAGSSRANGANIVQGACGLAVNGSDSFRLQAYKGGHRIIARHSNKCVMVKNGTARLDTAIIQSACTGLDHEIFTIGSLGKNWGGKWSPVMKFPLVPVSAALIPSGNIVMWSAYDSMKFGGDRGYTKSALFNTKTRTSTAQTITNTGHDMFCPGTTQMADGRIMVTGGSSAAKVSIYNPWRNTWKAKTPMNKPRGYHSSATLSDGSVIVVGGSWSGGVRDKGAEVFKGNKWRNLSGVSTIPMNGPDPSASKADTHMWLFPWTGNRVFQAGPSRNMHMINTAGNGSVARVGTRGTDNYAMNGTAVMYDVGKILTTGGATAYTAAAATGNANIVDINAATVRTSAIPAMRRPRAMHHSVVLPTGQVFVVGGQEVANIFQDSTAVLTPELFDPATNRFKVLAPMSVPRTYHSTALLMADARVFVAGGGLCGACETNHLDGQIFTPPYLLNANGREKARPRITSASKNIIYGSRTVVRTDRAVSKFSLVRLATATHSVNTDQRRIPVAFTGNRNAGYTLQIPGDAGKAPPGYYMLFAMDAAGTPSVSRITRLRR